MLSTRLISYAGSPRAVYIGSSPRVVSWRASPWLTALASNDTCTWPDQPVASTWILETSCAWTPSLPSTTAATLTGFTRGSCAGAR